MQTQNAANSPTAAVVAFRAQSSDVASTKRKELCLQPHDPDLALKIYFKGGAHLKVIHTLVQRGDFAKIMTRGFF